MSENDKKVESSKDSAPCQDFAPAKDFALAQDSASTQDSLARAQKEPRLKAVVSGANELSVGISLVVAVLLGIGIGYGLEYVSGIRWLFWLGVFWGIAAAILNLYKAYKRQVRESQELAQNPRYAYHADTKSNNAESADEDEQDNGKYY